MLFSAWYKLDSWYRSWFLLIFILRLISNICLKNSLKEMDKRSKIFLLVIINFFLDNLLVLLGENWYQWRIQGRGPECPPPPLFLFSLPLIWKSRSATGYWSLLGLKGLNSPVFASLTSPPAKAFLLVCRRRVFFHASQASANSEASVELKSCAKEGREESLSLHVWLKLFPSRKVLAYENA